MTKILVVDDERDHLDIASKTLVKSGYDIVQAHDGFEALATLNETPDIDVVVLDRMMPGLEGLQVLHRMRLDPRFKRTQVVFQTALSETHDIEQGMAAGAYYYLTKPYEPEKLNAIVRAAVARAKATHTMEALTDRAREKLELFKGGMHCIHDGTFQYGQIEQGHKLAPLLACCFARPRQVVVALTELMDNAVEHGNLGITAEQKAQWVMEGTYNHHLLEMMEANRKRVSVDVERAGSDLQISITDEGEGFDPERYMKLDFDRATKACGRGIAIAKDAFKSISYENGGKTVVVTAEGL